MGYNKSADDGARITPSINDLNEQSRAGTSLQDAVRPVTAMGDHTVAANRLPTPQATGGHTMGSKPGAKNPAAPGLKKAF